MSLPHHKTENATTIVTSLLVEALQEDKILEADVVKVKDAQASIKGGKLIAIVSIAATVR